MPTDTVHLAPNKISSDVVPLDRIVPSALNPRKRFEPEKLQELADSIKRLGLMEPIVVRWLTPLAAGAKFEIVAGERRYRASILAGLAEVPIRNLGFVDDKTALEMALVENLQRADLDPIEEAEGYASLNRVVGLKQAEIAKAVNRSQPTIANRMRLLELPTDVQDRIRSGELSPSHGVALAKFSGFPAIASKLAEVAAENHWTSANLEPSLPAAYTLREEGLVIAIRSWGFDSTLCKTACPFQAYRMPSDYSNGHCLRPDHYAELIRQHDEARELALRHDEEERRAALGESVSATGEASDAAAESETPVLLNTAKMSGDQYSLIDRSIDGCTEGCSCRAQAMHWGRRESVCLNPPARRLLALRATIAKNKARKAEVKALRDRLKTKLDALIFWGEKEWIIISTQAIAHPIETHRVTPKWRELTKIAASLSGDPVERLREGSDIASLEKITKNGSIIALAKLVIGAILGGELDAYFEGLRGDASLTKWYLGEEDSGVQR